MKRIRVLLFLCVGLFVAGISKATADGLSAHLAKPSSSTSTRSRSALKWLV